MTRETEICDSLVGLAIQQPGFCDGKHHEKTGHLREMFSRRYVKPRQKPTGNLNSETRLDYQPLDEKRPVQWLSEASIFNFKEVFTLLLCMSDSCQFIAFMYRSRVNR